MAVFDPKDTLWAKINYVDLLPSNWWFELVLSARIEMLRSKRSRQRVSADLFAACWIHPCRRPALLTRQHPPFSTLIVMKSAESTGWLGQVVSFFKLNDLGWDRQPALMSTRGREGTNQLVVNSISHWYPPALGHEIISKRSNSS